MLGKSVLFKAALGSAATLSILAGWFQLVRFSTTAGEQSPAPAALPAVLPAGLFPSDRLPLLLVFVHPQCSCTAATFEQLDQLLNQVPNPVDLVLAVYDSAALHGRQPIQPGTGLHHPYRILADPNGRLARRFGAATSGEILLYSPSRQLLFQGGITPGRAHTGINPSSQELLAALVSGHRAATASRPQSAVFGCPIFHLAHTG